MRRIVSFLLATVILAALVPQALAQTPPVTNGDVYVQVTDDQVVIGNSFVERAWSRHGWATTSFVDKRSGSGVSGGSAPDFTLDIGTTSVASDSFEATQVSVEEIEGALHVEATLTPLAGMEPGLTLTRIIEAYDGIAGVKTQTRLTTAAPVVLRGYSLDQVAVGESVAPTLHAFRAGADWREPDWGGPDGSLGDPHAGTWRDTDTAAAGEALAGPAQWISVAKDGSSLFMVMERNDYPSSRAGYDGDIAELNVDYSADIVMLGPLEESGHIENPNAGETPGRHRVLKPLTPYTTEAAFVGFGANPDDEPWQFYKYLSEHRLDPYDNEVTFNSNGTDGNVRSDGAKDDLTQEVIDEVEEKAKRLGIETFILDDGWQARSGDWEPDCGDTPGASNTDPRWDGTTATAKFAPRFEDCSFEGVRNLIDPMELGLWMNVMHFHPRSEAYLNHPQWACKPVGDGLGATSLVQPSGGSNDAGLGTWSAHPGLMAHIESRIQRAIDEWHATYFKFDFLVWLDCVGQNDLYEHKEAFLAMLDALIERNRQVTFEIDETNDYRLFPFESVSRGPSWFQNGSPEPNRLLHNIWNLSPFIPAYSLGQHFLGGNQFNRYPVDTLMAAALPSHMTFFSDLRSTPDAVIDQAAPWVAFHKANKELFTQMTYPLLADPLELKWTALQTWNPEEGRGALLAFRQQADSDTQTIALKNVPPGMTFDLFEGPSGNKVGTVTSQELSAGLDVTIPNKDGARVLLIKRVPEPTELTYDGPGRVDVGGTLNFTAALRGTSGPIRDGSLIVSFRGKNYAGVTNEEGEVDFIGLKQPGPPGIYELVISYAGSGWYAPSRISKMIRVGR